MTSPTHCGKCDPATPCQPPCPNVPIDWLVFEHGKAPRIVRAPDGRTLRVEDEQVPAINPAGGHMVGQFMPRRRHLPGRSFLLADKLYRVASDEGNYDLAGTIRTLKPDPYSSFYDAPRRYEQ